MVSQPAARTPALRVGRAFVAGVLAIVSFAGCDVGERGDAVPLQIEGSAAPQPWTRYPTWSQTNWEKFNTLVKLATPPAPKPNQLRTTAGEIKGDPEKGRKLSFDRSRGGSCLICHVMGTASDEQPGNFGPDLSEIGKAGRTDEFLFNYIYDARVYNPQAEMPPWGAHGFFSEEEIKDIVAFLKTLKEPAKFRSRLDDPNLRPMPVEDRDNLDPFTNPAINALELGKELFARRGAKGAACATCHAKPEETLKTWAAHMPKYEPRLDKMLGVEEFVARHGVVTTGDRLLMQSSENLALSIYLRSLANSVETKVDITGKGAKEAFKRGEALARRKIGQLNYACVDCHTEDHGAKKWVRGQYLTLMRGQTPHFPTWRTSQEQIWDIRKRFQWCGVAIRANELPPDHAAYGDLELYLTSFSNGLPINVPGIRH
jgi:sulfur-oxidizing protein SoxA